MKKSLSIALGLALAASTSLAGNLITRSFLQVASDGPDTYSNGAPVVQGDLAYQIVFLKNGAAFAGLHADGSAADSENNTLLARLAATDTGSLAPTTLQYDVADFADGSFALVLVEPAESGRVRGCSLLSKASVNAISGMSAASEGGTQVAGGVKIDGSVPAPVITAFAAAAPSFDVAVQNIASVNDYAISSSPDLVNWTVGETRFHTVADAEAALTAAAEAAEGDAPARFFKIVAVGE